MYEDYDFSIRLREHNEGSDSFSIPSDFGDLHGKLFKDFLESETYKKNFSKPPVICLSVSDNKVYQRTENQHPVLGVEYLPNESSLTEQYFKKMGFEVRYFMPPNSVAPLAFYHFGDLLSIHDLELIGTISTMETFRRSTGQRFTMQTLWLGISTNRILSTQITRSRRSFMTVRNTANSL